MGVDGNVHGADWGGDEVKEQVEGFGHLAIAWILAWEREGPKAGIC